MAAQLINPATILINTTYKSFFKLDHDAIEAFNPENDQKLDEIVNFCCLWLKSTSKYTKEMGKFNKHLINKSNSKFKFALNDFLVKCIFMNFQNELSNFRVLKHKKRLFRDGEIPNQKKIFNKIVLALITLFNEESIEFPWAIRAYRVLIYENFNKGRFRELHLNEITSEKILVSAKKILYEQNKISRNKITPLDLDIISAAYLFFFKIRKGKNVHDSIYITFQPWIFEISNSLERKNICDEFINNSNAHLKTEEIIKE